jgi:hypothetical protein
MKNETEKKGLFARVTKKEKKSSCCCNVELEEIPEDESNEKTADKKSEKDNDSCSGK